MERSGTNALGVRRPLSAAVPRCEAPSGRGLSAQPTGGEKAVWHLSLRQRFALTPPSQREARGNGFPRQCAHWLGMTGKWGGQSRPPKQSRTRTARNGTSRTPSPTGGRERADRVVRPYKLPPSALRAATSLAEGGKGDPHPLAGRDTWVPPYGLRYARPCRFFARLKCPPRKGRALVFTAPC